MLTICHWARKNKIRLHLDGARLFIAAAYTGITPAAYAAEFDTVYISLWKCFNCLNGAILAGSDHAQFDRLIHMRRMFGGALFNAWPFALLARHYAHGFVDRLKTAIAVSESFIASVVSEKIRVERVERGTNLFRLLVPAAKAAHMHEALRMQGVSLPNWSVAERTAVFTLHVNESWNAGDGPALAQQFQRAIG